MDSLAAYFLFGSCVLFVVVYTSMARGWWRTLVGLAMGVRDILIPVVLAPQVLHFAFGLSLAIDWFRLYYDWSAVALGVATLFRAWVVWWSPRHERDVP